jgi:hypothetical protein
LKVKFSEGPSQSAPDAGQNHKIEVFLGDSVREFKAKLTRACETEAKFYKQSKGADSPEAQKYDEVTIGHRHLVMVFVPSPKVQRLYAMKQHEGQEYKLAYQQALVDPSSWQPLDPARSCCVSPRRPKPTNWKTCVTRSLTGI